MNEDGEERRNDYERLEDTTRSRVLDPRGRGSIDRQERIEHFGFLTNEQRVTRRHRIRGSHERFFSFFGKEENTAGTRPQTNSRRQPNATHRPANRPIREEWSGQQERTTPFLFLSRRRGFRWVLRLFSFFPSGSPFHCVNKATHRNITSTQGGGAHKTQ